jgi:hypothetical protein
MRVSVSNLLVVLLVVSSGIAQQRPKPRLQIHCSAQPTSFAPAESIDLSISLENVSASDVYLYKMLEWGWAGVRFRLTNSSGKIVELRNWTVPPPPIPINGKEQLVGIAPAYFYGTHLRFSLGQYYDLKPGDYFLQVAYQSNYRNEDGFGLPILTFQDGEFLSNKVHVEIRPT